MKKFMWLLVIGVLAPLSAVMAQGSVRGKIVDEATGEPVEFVNILLNHKGNNNMAGGTITDEQGSFRIEGLEFGSYVLTVSYIGYQNATREFTLSSTAKNAHFKQIAISDPTMKVTGEHTLILEGTYTLDGECDKVSVTAEGGKTTVVIDMTGSEGQSIQINLRKK